jgi:hypothetical protein
MTLQAPEDRPYESYICLDGLCLSQVSSLSKYDPLQNLPTTTRLQKEGYILLRHSCDLHLFVHSNCLASYQGETDVHIPE